MRSIRDLHATLVRDTSVQCDLLTASLVFPRTAALSKPLVAFTPVAFSLDVARAHVRTHPELVTLGARDDVYAVIDLLFALSDELCLTHYEAVQVHRGGLPLLRIVNANKSSDADRAVFVEINDYRRRLQDYALTHRRTDVWGTAALALVVCVFVAVYLKHK